MATLGLSVLISVLPYRFHGLKALGIIIYIFGLTQYASIIFSVIARFILHRGTFKRSLEKPSEALFLATVSFYYNLKSKAMEMLTTDI